MYGHMEYNVMQYVLYVMLCDCLSHLKLFKILLGKLPRTDSVDHSASLAQPAPPARCEEMAEAEHTALLLKCYTKLKDFTTLEEAGETTKK